MLRQREEYNAKRDSLSYPPIPGSELFQNQEYGYEKPKKIHGWDWSITFNRWTALVTLENGWRGYTFPKL